MRRIWCGFLTLVLLLVLLPNAAMAEETVVEPDPNFVFRVENQTINSNYYTNLNTNLDALKVLEEGTIIVKFQYSGSSIMSLFSLSNNTLANGHFHLYITPTAIGSENRYEEPGKTSSNTHVKTGAIVLTPNDVHTVAMVVDKTQGYKYFLDGELIKADTTSARKFLNHIYAPNTAELGRTDRPAGSNEYPFTGKIDFAEVYRTPLSDEVLIERTKAPQANVDLSKVKKMLLSTTESSQFLFTGDDIAFAAGQAKGYRNYMQHFEERIRWEIASGIVQRNNFVFNTGMAGMTSSELLLQFNRLVTDLHPKAVFVMLGTADANNDTPIEDFTTNVIAIADQIRAIGAVPVFQTPVFPTNTAYESDITPYVEALKEVASEESLLLVNHFDSWKAYSDRLTLVDEDGKLPNELGHLRLGKELMTYFGVGGGGNTWNINNFTDTKEAPQQHWNQDIDFTQSGSVISVNLGNTLVGIPNLDKAVITLESEDGSYTRETTNLSSNISMGSIAVNKPYTLTVKAKLSNQDKYVIVNSAYIQSEQPVPVEIPAELSALLEGNEPVTWLFNGDSITHGALHTKGYKSFAELFGERILGELAATHAARAQDLVLNTGVSSMTTRDLMANFDKWITANNPDVVFLAFGMNDSSNRLVPISEFESNLETAVDQVKAIGAIPILETINTIKPADSGRATNLPEYVEVIRRVAQEKQVLLVDHYKYWTDAEKKQSHVKSIWLNDNIHPNYIGSTGMAAAIFETLGIDDSNSYIANLRYVVPPTIGALNYSPVITVNNNLLSLGIAPIVAAAGGINAVDYVESSILLGNLERFIVQSSNPEGTLVFEGLEWGSTYTVKTTVKVKGQNKLLTLNDATVSTPIVDIPMTILTGDAEVLSQGQVLTLKYGLAGVNKVYAQDIQINYDPGALEYVPHSMKSIKDGVVILNDPQADSSGKLRVIIASTGTDYSITGKEELLELSFKPANRSHTAATSIQVSKAMISNDLGEEFSISSSSLTVQIQAMVTSDINGDGKTSIGDLALIAAHYGKDSTSSDWSQIKSMDLDASGIIDIADLSIVAQKIIE
ncbi:MAG: GDSL-type esterase/lipase family protein [Candidatus Pristimantibacillus sp.]